jgi:hypothetical protein
VPDATSKSLSGFVHRWEVLCSLASKDLTAKLQVRRSTAFELVMDLRYFYCTGYPKHI